MLQQRDAGEDEQRAQNNRAEHAPQQRLVLPAGADAEALKYDQEDEKVVDAERRLNGPTADELKRRLPARGHSQPHGKSG